MLSLIVHLVGGSLYGLISRAVVKVLPQWASLQAPPLPKSDVIRLEKAVPTPVPVAVAKPVVRPPAAAPRPHEHVAQIPAPAVRRHELSHVVIHAPRQFAPSRGEGVAEPPHVVDAGPKARKAPFYSDEQLAALDSGFAKTIHDSNQTPQQANAAMNAAPVMTTAHFQMHFNGIHEGMNPGDGLITIIKAEMRNKIAYYWTHYQYMYGDGHVEEDDIPWVFAYPPGTYDPFAHHDRRVPIQEPPAGYKPNRPLKPVLEQFFGGPKVG